MKKNPCLFCGKTDRHLARHFFLHHKMEARVVKIMALSTKKDNEASERKRLLQKLTDEGRAKYNFENPGLPIAKYESRIGTPKAACPYCKNLFMDVRRHAMTCIFFQESCKISGYITPVAKKLWATANLKDGTTTVTDPLILINTMR